ICHYPVVLPASSLTVGQVGQNFTFVLTDIDSKQRFGFCRLSSGAKTCFCILSYLPWFEVFYKLLSVLADYTAKGQDNQWYELLDTLLKLPIPEPATSVHLSVHSYFTVPDIRELPSIPENRNLTEYFVAVDVNTMLHLYASMLYERRILICCSKLSTLTACVHGSAAMLYPMFWQHVYIPVLPPHLLDYCCAPMPYLIGIHLSLMEKVRNMALEDVVILNVDTNTLETPFDDLQSLPNDVVSALKGRLKKVSMTTGDGVARAFLKAQAAFFGSYRSALKIEPGEPITFCEETFISHRSAAMRQFLQNAIQLQLFKQFIDGRLDLLNSGEGFSDVFEEEINMGEYAGSDKLYHQWLSTVRKGSGAILNTVKTKANPAMKTVYKFAKDHAKMGIKEVKNRLKQKDITENGCATVPEDSVPQAAPSPLAEKRDPRLREDRRPITTHFGQVRPPRPHVARRPRSHVAVDGRRTSVSSPEQPQPYRTLKESDSADGEEGLSLERPRDTGRADPPTPESPAELSLLEGLFSGLEVEPPPPPPLSQAKSLEDLRIPPDALTPVSFRQRTDPAFSEESWAAPGMKRAHHYKQPWGLGCDDMAIPSKLLQSSPERPLTPLGNVPPVPWRPRSRDSILDLVEKEAGGPVGTQGSITIPRPQGRKTPELGIVPPPPPAPRPAKQQTFAAGSLSRDPEFGQPSGLASQPPLPLLSSAGGAAEMLQPVRVTQEGTNSDSDFLLSLLDPLKAGGGPEPLAFPRPAAPFVPAPLNPFVPAMLLTLARPPGGSFASPLGHAYSSSFITSSSSFFPPQQPPPNPLTLSMPNLFAQAPAAPLQPPQPTHSGALPPARRGGPSKIRTLPLAHPASKLGGRAGPAARPSDLPLAPHPAGAAEAVLRPSGPREARDPFEELLSKTRQEVSVTPGKVEQLRRQWETFE
uniref:DENN domain containing 1A n=1 Tax=Varanus komodoensis TaxID=61221 RepID=A0A8D2LUX5_VARKO